MVYTILRLSRLCEGGRFSAPGPTPRRTTLAAPTKRPGHHEPLRITTEWVRSWLRSHLT